VADAKILGLVAGAILLASPTWAKDCDTDAQIEALALNMYHEARGEGPEGMIMVAEVTLNRMEHSRFPDTICDVVYQRSAFSWTKTRSDTVPHETEKWDEALLLAEEIIHEEFDEFLETGATHFVNPKAVKRMPNWTTVFEQVGSVGNHVFYRKPDNRG